MKCVLVGYCSESKAYRLFDPIASKVIVSRDVIFHENSRWNWEANGSGSVITLEELNSSEDGDKNNSGAEKTNNSEGSSSSSDAARDLSSSGGASDESPPWKTRSLAEVYNSCTYALHVGDP